MSRPYKLQWENAVFEDPSLTPTQKLVGLAVCWYARSKDGGNAFPSVETIARRTSLSRRSVQTALRQLRERAYLVDETPPEMKRMQHREGWANVYRLIFPEAARGARSEPTGATDDFNGCSSRPGSVRQLHPNTHMNTPDEHSDVDTSASASPTALDDDLDEDRTEELDLIAEKINGYGAGEEPMAWSLLDQGWVVKGIVNAINKDRYGSRAQGA